MSHIANKIVAQDKALHSVFSETRYRIDTFQREYRVVSNLHKIFI